MKSKMIKVLLVMVAILFIIPPIMRSPRGAERPELHRIVSIDR